MAVDISGKNKYLITNQYLIFFKRLFSQYENF